MSAVTEVAPPQAAKRVGAREWAGFMALVVGMFMAILDIQIVASSLAEIQAGIGASIEEIGWVQTSYLIAEVIMIPLSGWLARVFSTRWLFFVSCVTFTAASVACAFAWSLESMIVFRALQGFLGGAMIPTVFATSFRLFPRERQAGVSVLIGLVATMAPTLGPTLGGWITQTASWHWLFLINVVPGVIVSVLVLLFVRVDRPDLGLLKKVDLPGIALVAIFLGCLQYVLEEGPGEDWFANRHILAISAISAAGAVLFFWRELTIAHPVIELRAFVNRNFAIGCAFSFVIGVGLYGSVYLMPLYLGQVRGYDAYEIGVTMMVTGMFQFLSAPLAGMLARKIDLRLMLAIGLGLFGLGLYLNAGVTAEWGYWELFVPQAVRGLSLMLCFVPINNIALGLLPHEQLQNASGLYNLMRNLGGAIGLAVINTQLASRFDMHLAHLAERVNGARIAVSGAFEGLTARLEPLLGLDAEAAALKLMHGLVTREAMVLTFADLFLMVGAVFAVALSFMPLVRKVRPAGADAGGH